MRTGWLVLVVVFAMAGCTTTDVRRAPTAATSAARDAKVLVVYPDIQLAVLTASGLEEPREDWSRDATAHLASALQQALQARNHSHEVLDPQASMDGRVGQVLRLSTAVGQSIFAFEYGALRLPSKGNAFDWTVGDGAATLASRHGADYALFVGGRGAFASAGRKALMVGAALLGYGIPLGSQQVYLSLVELRTGRVLWFNVATAGNGTDIRDAEGARGIVDTLLTSAPL